MRFHQFRAVVIATVYEIRGTVGAFRDLVNSRDSY